MRLLVLCSVTIVSACAGNGAGLDANGQPLGSGSAPPPPLAADFQSIQDNVFTPICVRCHSGAAAPQGLELDAAHSYALLVGVPSDEQSGLLRVRPGAPDSSYLVLKLEGAAGIVGVQMPFGAPALPQSTIDVIRQWISDGAALAEGNPRVLLITPRRALGAGRYRLTLRGNGGGALADVDARVLGDDYTREFTVDTTP